MKVALGILVGIVLFAVLFKPLYWIVTIVVALSLGLFGLSVSSSPDLLSSVQSFGYVMALVGAAWLAERAYARISGKSGLFFRKKKASAQNDMVT